MNREELKIEAKTFLTYSRKLNARVKPDIQKTFLEKVISYHPECETFNEAVYFILNDLKVEDTICPICKDKKRRFYRFSTGYNKTCGKTTCTTANRESWIKGLTKETDSRVAKLSKNTSKAKRGKPLSEKQQEHLNDMIENNKGKKRDPEIFKKVEKTCLKKYGVKSPLCLKKNRKKSKKALFDKYGGYYGGSEEFQENKEQIFSRMKQTNIERYGVPHATQNPKVKAKIFKTKKKKGNLKKSEIEDDVYSKLKKRFEVKRHYSNDKYPYACDFYLPEFDLFIEVNAHWTHGKHLYDFNSPEDKKILQKWEEMAKYSPYYKNAIDVWTVRDVEKYRIAKENNLNILFIYETEVKNIYSVINSYVFKNYFKDKYTLPYRKLSIKYSNDILLSELSCIKNYISSGKTDFNDYYSPNSIIENFQDSFYLKENELWKKEDVRKRLVSNRVYYLNKKPSDLSDRKLLKGFKVSGVHKGYSHFSIIPLLWFIRKYKITSIYDPCGGWGHRYLGSLSIDYIYADNSTDRYNGVLKIHDFISKYFDVKGKKIFKNWDSSAIWPSYSYDSVFTCPPYYNMEDYGEVPKYQEWLDTWWRNIVKFSIVNCKKYFAFIINDKYKEDMISVALDEGLTLIKEQIVSTLKYYFQKNSDRKDNLLVFSV